MGPHSNASCIHCQSENQHTFSGELALHFRGLEGLNKPIIWVFEDISVCLECGYAQFDVTERAVKILRTEVAVDVGSACRGNKIRNRVRPVGPLSLA
jgi:hypothetical protein